MVKYIESKTILSKIKNGPDDFFGTLYSMNLYRGCQHQCIYCDSRSMCYRIENFSDILIKKNALELLEKELKSKRKKGVIGFGSMNDAYMPIEKEQKLAREALKIIAKYNYPVHIITKSDLVLRDLDILKEISKIYAAVSITITAADDILSKKIEPGAPKSSARFNAVKILNENGIYSGITMMPILPLITDYLENIKMIIRKASESNAQYILGFMGLTQREGQREYFYRELDKLFPGIKNEYIKLFGNRYECNSPDIKVLYNLYNEFCKKYMLKTRMDLFVEKDIPNTIPLWP